MGIAHKVHSYVHVVSPTSSSAEELILDQKQKRPDLGCLTERHNMNDRAVMKQANVCAVR